MRAANRGNKWADVNVSYSSDLWKDKLPASEVFINPTVGSGQGTRQLIAIAHEGLYELTLHIRELATEGAIASSNHMYIHYTSRVEAASENGANLTKEESERAFAEKLQPFELQKLRFTAAHGLLQDLLGKFSQLNKVASSILGSQEELGDKLTSTVLGVQKLTVSIKCLDSIWADIVDLYGKFIKMRADIIRAKSTIPKVAGYVEPLDMSLLEANGNDQGPMSIIILEPSGPDSVSDVDIDTLKTALGILDRVTEVTDEEEDINTDIAPAPAVSSRVEEVADEEEDVNNDVAATPALSSGEGTLVDEFDDKCQLESTSQDATTEASSDTTDSTIPELIDSSDEATVQKTEVVCGEEEKVDKQT